MEKFMSSENIKVNFGEVWSSEGRTEPMSEERCARCGHTESDHCPMEDGRRDYCANVVCWPGRGVSLTYESFCPAFVAPVKKERSP